MGLLLTTPAMYHHCPQFRSYDGHFILKYLLDNQYKGVKVIKRGTQSLDLQYQTAEINARGTLNIVQQKVATFPKAVGLNHMDVKKGDFRHYANVPQNWNHIIHFPDVKNTWVRQNYQQKPEFFGLACSWKAFLRFLFLIFGSKWWILFERCHHFASVCPQISRGFSV